MLKHVREIYEYGKPLGFGEPELQGNDHYRMTHENGGIVVFSNTPSDWRAKANTIADMHRVSETKAEKPNAAKMTFKKQHSRLHTERTQNEERAIDQAHRLSSQWEEAIERLQKISDTYDECGRDAAGDALGWVLWQKLDEIESELADINRRPPSAIPWPRPASYEEYVEFWLGRWPDEVSPVTSPVTVPVTPPEPGGLVWEDPAPAPRGRGTEWQPIIDQLKQRPGSWAIVATDASRSIQSYLPKAYPGVEAKARGVKNGRVAKLYARWVGET